MPITINGSTGIAGVDGSASTPAIQGTDTNTGVTFPAADTVAVSTGGTERMRVDSSGNVGIGTSSPSSKLHVEGVNVISTLKASSGYAVSVINAAASSTTALAFQTNSVDTARLTAQSDSTLVFSNGSGLTERARIDSSGNVGIGTTGPTAKLQVNGGSCAYLVCTGVANALSIKKDNTGGNLAAFSYNTTDVGTISTNGTGVTYGTASDYRLKENVQPMQNALATVALLNPVTYTWKADGSDGQGFIAHELQAVVPDCVRGEKDEIDNEGKPVYQNVDTSFLVATLTKAIQELSAKVDALQTEINALKGAA